MELHGLSMFPLKAKIYGVLYKQASSIAFDKTSSYWSAPKSSYFSTFHWSPQGSLVSIGQHFITTNINIEIEVDLNTESDQAMWAVHSCNSWFLSDLALFLCCENKKGMEYIV